MMRGAAVRVVGQISRTPKNFQVLATLKCSTSNGAAARRRCGQTRELHFSPIRRFAHPSSRSSEQQDVAIALLSTLMDKHDTLKRIPDAYSQPEVAKELDDLSGLRKIWDQWKDLQKTAASVMRMTEEANEPDEDMRQLAIDEAHGILEDIVALRKQIRAALLPRDPLDLQSAIVELRPGVGGEESAVFTAEMARMYARFCEDLDDFEDAPNGLKVEQLSTTPIDVSANSGSRYDACKEVILSIQGQGAYGLLRSEGGVHRVQRVPVTVSVTKMQSSAIAVIVLPGGSGDGEQSNKEQDDLVDAKDVKEEVMRSRGAGGQHVNKTESAVRLTHEPTGITVSMQDSRSQHQNRSKAWQVLRARLLDRRMREDQAEKRDVRRGQVASMNRQDRIRTYNFPQDRVTDHRIPLSTNGIDSIMEGNADDGGLLYLIRAYKEHQQEATLVQLKEQAERELVQLKATVPST